VVDLMDFTMLKGRKKSCAALQACEHKTKVEVVAGALTRQA
jgi:hypothetical protein